MSPLFSPLKAGSLTWPNRIVMAPLTRGRATVDGVPTPIMAQYYALRADAGLIITEATAISRQGYGWVNAPGIYTEAQAKGWVQVTDAVRQAGGRIYLQLWHMGRTSHPDFQNGQLPVAPSAIAARGNARTPGGPKPYAMPHALTPDEIAPIIRDYADASKRAMDAGFDGVEIHAANGYLLDEFLRDCSNKRTDAYGGSIPNRLRLLGEVTEAVARTVGSDRTGIRLSPRNPHNDMSDTDPAALFGAAAAMLNQFRPAYLHVLEALPGHRNYAEGERISPLMRQAFKGVFIANGGYSKALSEQALVNHEADAIAYGVPFIANPDLVERLRLNAPLNATDPETYYSPGEKGYLDYPLLADRKDTATAAG